MDEVGQIDLLIGVVGGRRRIAQRHRQIGNLGNDLVGQVHEEPQRGTDDIVQGDQDGEGQEGPQAAGHGVDALLGVQVGHLLLLPLLVVGVAGLDILDLALHPVHAQHALLALHLEGQDHQLHHQGEEDQRHAVGTGQAVEHSRQPCERHTDVISDLCKHVFFLRRLLLVLRAVTNAWEHWVKHPKKVFTERDRTSRPCGTDGTGETAAGQASRPSGRRTSPPPPARTGSRWG